MTNLLNLLYELYMEELNDLFIGYQHNVKRINHMWELIQIIDFIQHGNPTEDELRYLLEYYG